MIATFTMTKLRADILNILKEVKGAIKPYDLLKELRKIRPNAQPPTVYRVLDFFKKKQIIHEIASQNSYILCQHDQDHCHSCLKEQSHCLAVLFVCSNCHEIKEKNGTQLTKLINNYAKTENFKLPSSSTLELIGLCSNCK